MSFKQIERNAAKKHILLAIDEFSNSKQPMPDNHEELIERLRDYFEGQKVEVFSKLLFDMGEEDFREFIEETVLDSGKYYRDPDGQVRPKRRAA